MEDKSIDQVDSKSCNQINTHQMSDLELKSNLNECKTIKQELNDHEHSEEKVNY